VIPLCFGLCRSLFFSGDCYSSTRKENDEHEDELGSATVPRSPICSEILSVFTTQHSNSHKERLVAHKIAAANLERYLNILVMVLLRDQGCLRIVAWLYYVIIQASHILDFSFASGDSRMRRTKSASSAQSPFAWYVRALNIRILNLLLREFWRHVVQCSCWSPYPVGCMAA